MSDGLQGTIEEGVSVYDIIDHTDYAFQPSDVVVRLHVNQDEGDSESSKQPAGQVRLVYDAMNLP